jgi:hypothetical protein
VRRHAGVPRLRLQRLDGHSTVPIDHFAPPQSPQVPNSAT